MTYVYTKWSTEDNSIIYLYRYKKEDYDILIKSCTVSLKQSDVTALPFQMYTANMGWVSGWVYVELISYLEKREEVITEDEVKTLIVYKELQA